MQTYDLQLPARRGAHSKTPVVLAPPRPDDDFAPAPSGCRCTSRTGYRRRHHTFDRDGRCVFCGHHRHGGRS